MSGISGINIHGIFHKKRNAMNVGMARENHGEISDE